MVLKGVFGQQALPDTLGFRRGRQFIAWKDVGALQINTVNFSTNLLLIPQGVSDSFFSFKKHKHHLAISEKKKELYIAECNYWISKEEHPPEISEQLEELARLKEQGVLSEQQFQAAKKDLLGTIG